MDTIHKIVLAIVASIAALWHDPAPIITLGIVIGACVISSYATARYVLRATSRELDKKIDQHIANFHAESRAFRDAVHRDAADDGD